MSRNLRAGVIGLGWAGQQHLDGYQRAAGVDLVGLAGMEPEPLQRLADEYGIEHRYADWADLVKDADLDVVSVCTPPSLHAPITVAALEAGINVLSEKPMALDAASARTMVDAAKANGKILDISFNHRRKAEVTAAKDLIDKGLLGDIYYAKAGWMRHNGIPGGVGNWFSRKATSGGGPLMDIGVHMLDMALHLMGEPSVQTVTASTYAAFGPRGRGRGQYGAGAHGAAEPVDFEVEDLATAFVRMDNGATLLLESSWAQGVGHDDMYVTLFGTEGGAELTWNPPAPQLRAWTTIDGVDASLNPQLGLSGGHAEAVADFVAAVRDHNLDGHQGEEALTRSLIVDATYHSAAESTEIRLSPAPPQPAGQDAVVRTAG
ncbi:Gfo/Idh/MocA family oxidoreductase [Microlunatus elymi]|uniref:Gfo/Idh/MocA family oxidoreductase n=1 Tax=Microlunatus elymi TaxID=2596828 RepID=A0A516PZ98_9ACTN|nr:Gfo/Idh/MocA family oxidoreductase [Microlunatus elymi]QDP96488.1 Gfo/Idh/MocA family oxidoreductase [Microlunatus elymi]